MSDCIFCKIANKEINSTAVFEDETVIAFKDLSPQAPQHVLIIPKKHIGSLNELNESDKNLVSHILVDVLPQIVKSLNIDESGYRVVINTGDEGGQTVKHLHFHILGGRNMTWPPG